MAVEKNQLSSSHPSHNIMIHTVPIVVSFQASMKGSDVLAESFWLKSACEMERSEVDFRKIH